VPSEERFDEALGKLQSIVEKLEGGKLTLEESLQAFEEGVRLAKAGQAILDAAEKRVDVLTRGPQGESVARPFDPGSAEE
jgi:exodeoxyribonuclease VII small subunit